jgi:RNA polymerase sigma-70 factor (ECF subfamily)
MLVVRARGGDSAAMDVLFRRHARAVLGLAVRLMGRQQDADDVAQEAFVTALDELNALREPAAFKGWLLQITVRQAHRKFRRRKIERLLGLDRGQDDATLTVLVGSSADAEARAELNRVDVALKSLEPKDRIAWTLRYIEGEALEDVARLCECSLATAKRRIAAAREAMIARGVLTGSDQAD